MTKTQAKAQARKLIEKLLKLNDELRDLQDELGDLNADVEDTRDAIEPYENRDELTAQQEERYNFFDKLHDYLENVIGLDIEDDIIALQDFVEEN